MNKMIEELRLKMTIDTSSLDSDGKKIANKLNNSIKEVLVASEKLNRTFDLMTPKQIKDFEVSLKKIGSDVLAASKEFEKNNLSKAVVGDTEKSAKELNKLMNGLIKSYGGSISAQNKIRDNQIKSGIKVAEKAEKTKLDLSLVYAKSKANKELLIEKEAAAKRLIQYKAELANRRREEQKANKPSFIQGVGRAGSILSKYAFGSVLASPAFLAADFVKNTASELAKGAIQYSRDMAKIKAITNSTTEDMASFDKSIRNIGSALGYTNEEGTQAILMLSRLGVESRNLSGVLESTASFATATGSSLEKSGELLVNTMNAFNIAYEKSDYVVNQMTKTLNSSALDVEKYATILGYVGAAAKENNVTFEDTNAMLTLLSQNGLKASTVGTSMREIIGTLSKDGKTLSGVIDELAKNNISYADAVELVGKRAANALTILVKHNDELKKAGQYIQANVLDTKAQAELMAQFSLAEQLARSWTSAMTAAKSFFGVLLNENTEDITKRMLTMVGVAEENRGFGKLKTGDISNRDVKGLAGAFKLQIQEYLSGLTNEQRDKLGFGATNQAEFEKNFASAISNYLKGNEIFKEQKGTDELANKIASQVTEDTRDARAEAFKQKVMQEVKNDLITAQRENKQIVTDNKFIYDKILETTKRLGGGIYKIRYTESDVESIKQTGVTDLNEKNKAYSEYKKAKSVREWYDKLGMKATLADRDKMLEAEAKAKSLNDTWKFEEKKSGGRKKQEPTIGTIRGLLEPLNVASDIKATLGEIETVSAEYKKQMGATTDKQEQEKIAKDYLKATKDLYEKLSGTHYTDIINGKAKELEDLSKLLDEVDAKKRSDLLNEFGGDTNNVVYKQRLANWDKDVDVLRRDIKNYNANQKTFLTRAQESVESVLNTTLKVKEFMSNAISYDDTQDMINLSYDIAERIKQYEEGLSTGNRKRRLANDKAGTMGRIVQFEKANESAYTKRTMELSERRVGLNRDLSIVSSGKPLTGEQKDYFRRKYYTTDLNKIKARIEKESQTIDKGATAAEAVYSRGKKTAASGRRSLRDFDETEESMVKGFISDSSKEAMDMMVDYYMDAQQRMLDAQRERVEAEIQNEREKTDRLNGMNQASVELGIMSQQQYAEEKAVMEKELYEKENALMKEQFENEKKAEIKMAGIKLTQKLAEIAMNVLVAESSKGLVGLIGVPATIGAFAGLATAQSALEIAAISKKEYVPKKYADGGIVGGNSHSRGGVPFTVSGHGGYEMEGGEFIVRKSQVSRNIGALSAINNGTFQSSSYYSGGNDISNKLDSLIELSSKPVRAYVTSGDLQKNERARIIISNKTQV